MRSRNVGAVSNTGFLTRMPAHEDVASMLIDPGSSEGSYPSYSLLRREPGTRDKANAEQCPDRLNAIPEFDLLSLLYTSRSVGNRDFMDGVPKPQNLGGHFGTEL